ncbi:MAG TPA: HepT-like ribonuclease domain-containing protein [Acidimicrobiales bacterium]|nr:HepT-like ribonuclease domain-containing protein [Acidimicrobiales bacterium]
MTEHDDYVYLDHIADISALLQSTARLGKERFLSNPDVRDATIYRLQTLAESTQRLSTGFKTAHPEVPWADIARFRNRAVHGYLGVDLEIIWDIVGRDIPGLSQVVGLEMERDDERSGLGDESPGARFRTLDE